MRQRLQAGAEAREKRGVHRVHRFADRYPRALPAFPPFYFPQVLSARGLGSVSRGLDAEHFAPFGGAFWSATVPIVIDNITCALSLTKSHVRAWRHMSTPSRVLAADSAGHPPLSRRPLMHTCPSVADMPLPSRASKTSASFRPQLLPSSVR